ncbi:unnamed protein product [Leptosia nina]|uniref:Reverse transcriptase domain-containing protein n=1 Tax=Leptosia nina TaxID=320188 RepID=A0AAV1J8L3_9NEOP
MNFEIKLKEPTTPSAPENYLNLLTNMQHFEGIRVLVYLDDFLIAHQDYNVLCRQVQIVLERLKYLVWRINMEKSITVPTKSLVVLGIHWNPWLNKKSIPESKSIRLQKILITLINSGITSISVLQSLIGLLNFVSFAVTQGRLHFRNALVFLNRQLKESLVHETVIPQKVKEDLVWWLANLRKPS